MVSRNVDDIENDICTSEAWWHYIIRNRSG